MTRATSTAGSGDQAGDGRRTTLSLVLATFAVAAGAFVGLGQAAASATTAARIHAVGGDTGANENGSEPASPTRGDAASAAASKLLAALGQLERLSDPIDGSHAVPEPTTITRRDVQTNGGDASPGSKNPAERPPTSMSDGSTPSTERAGSAPAQQPGTTTTRPEPDAASSTASSTRPPATVAPVSRDPMAIREWRPISDASFRRFVEACNFATTDHITPGLVHGTIVEHDQRVNVVLVHRSATASMRVSPGDRGREQVGDWAREIGATAAVNANWYDPFDGPAVSAGRVYGGVDHGYTALFGFTAQGDLVADHHHKIHDRVDPRVVEAVAGHPTLIHRGSPTTDFGSDSTFTDRNPRTAIGVSADVDVLILVTVDGRRLDAAGMTGAETTSLLQRLGAHDAVMLDGGGSTAMWITGKGIVNRQSEPGRAVGNQIAVFGR